MSNRVGNRKSFQPKLSKSLKPPPTANVQSKIDRVHSTFVSLTNRKLTSLPPQGTQPTLLSLDLENNQLKSSTLQNLPQTLTTINLVNNPLLDMKLPLLKNLRSISLDYCKLTSFKGFPMFPQLRFLSVSNNKLTSFKYLPPLLKLEYFDISNNSFEFSSKLSIAAIGSISMTTFNEVTLTTDDLFEAYQLSPLVGYSLRMGRDPTPCETPEEEIRKSQDFLTSKLAKHIESKGEQPITMNLNVCQYEGESSLICPVESETIKWYRSRSPDHGSEWVQITPPSSQKQNNILPITMFIRMHLIKCEFTLDNKTFAIFTDYPIGHDKQDLSLPFPLDPVIAGLPLEGSLISLIPLPLPARAAWLCQSRLIAQDVTSIILTNKEINQVIRCLLQPYCPDYPDVSFATVFVETDTVSPLLPTVSGLTFPENIVEGVKITFTRKIFPDREGKSQILVERARGITEEWFVVSELTKDDLTYIPSCSDAGHYLRVSYAPVTEEGAVGDTVFFYSSTRVLPTLPVFTNGVIGGLPKTNYTLCAVADYKGGIRGHCSYNWYVSDEPISSDNFKFILGDESRKVATDTQFFTIPPDYDNKYMLSEMVPVREDEVVGEPIYAVLSEPIIEDEPPEPLKVEIPTPLTDGMEINVKEQATFYISSTKGFCGFTEVKRGTSIVLKDKWVGRVLRITTKTADTVVGQIKQSLPVVRDVVIEFDKCVCGELAKLRVEPETLTPDNFQVAWIRCAANDIQKCVAFNCTKYIFKPHDIGFQIRVCVTPIDFEGNLLEQFYSDMTPIVKTQPINVSAIKGKIVEGESIYVEIENGKEPVSIKWLRSDPKKVWIDTKATDTFYTLSIIDVGRFLRAEVQTQGQTVQTVTTIDVCQPAEPVGSVVLNQETAYEGDVLKAKVSYYGGIEGKSTYRWKIFRPPDAMPVQTDGKTNGNKQNNGWEIVSETTEYTVKIEDIGSRLLFEYQPVRNDGREGRLVTKYIEPILARAPIVRNVKVIQNKVGILEVTGDYSGGVEDRSYYLWHAYDNDGKMHNIGKTQIPQIFPPEKLFGLKVEATYCPRRSDGEEGDQVKSSNYVVVQPLPSVLSLDILVKDSLIRVGQPMRCKATCSEGAKPKFQWFRWDGQRDPIPIEGATSANYTPTEEDANYLIVCNVTPVGSNGFEGKGIPTYTPTAVEPSDIPLQIIPQITRATNKEMYWTGAVLKTTFNDIVSWERKKENSNDDWEVVCDDVEYNITVCDVGCRIRAALGDVESKPSEVIVINPEVGSFVNAQVRAKSLVFKAKSAAGSTIWEFACDPSGITMRSKRTGPHHEKKSPWTSIRVEGIDGKEKEEQLVLWMDAATKFVLIPLLKGDTRFKAIVVKNARDFIVYTIQQFISLFVPKPNNNA